jgi:hypothetical protein
MSPPRHHLIDTQWFLKMWCQSRELAEAVEKRGLKARKRIAKRRKTIQRSPR